MFNISSWRLARGPKEDGMKERKEAMVLQAQAYARKQLAASKLERELREQERDNQRRLEETKAQERKEEPLKCQHCLTSKIDKDKYGGYFLCSEMANFDLFPALPALVDCYF